MRTENRSAERLSTSGAISSDLCRLASDVHSARQTLVQINKTLSSFVDGQLRVGKASSDACTSIEFAFGLMLSIQELSTRLTEFARLMETAGSQCTLRGPDDARRRQPRRGS